MRDDLFGENSMGEFEYQLPQPGGEGIWGVCLPEIFKTLHSNFDICRNFQTIDMKFCILIILKKSFISILLCPTG